VCVCVCVCRHSGPVRCLHMAGDTLVSGSYDTTLKVCPCMYVYMYVCMYVCMREACVLVYMPLCERCTKRGWGHRCGTWHSARVCAPCATIRLPSSVCNNAATQSCPVRTIDRYACCYRRGQSDCVCAEWYFSFVCVYVNNLRACLSGWVRRAGSADHSIKVWSLATGACLRTLIGTSAPSIGTHVHTCTHTHTYTQLHTCTGSLCGPLHTLALTLTHAFSWCLCSSQTPSYTLSVAVCVRAPLCLCVSVAVCAHAPLCLSVSVAVCAPAPLYLCVAVAVCAYASMCLCVSVAVCAHAPLCLSVPVCAPAPLYLSVYARLGTQATWTPCRACSSTTPRLSVAHSTRPSRSASTQAHTPSLCLCVPA
jgi:hypothetical protein